MSSGTPTPYIIDNANLLTAREANLLNRECERYERKAQLTLMVVTTKLEAPGLEGTQPQEVRDLFARHDRGFLYSASLNNPLLVITFYKGEGWTSSYFWASSNFDEFGFNRQSVDQMQLQPTDGGYADASRYLSAIEEIADMSLAARHIERRVSGGTVATLSVIWFIAYCFWFLAMGYRMMDGERKPLIAPFIEATLGFSLFGWLALTLRHWSGRFEARGFLDSMMGFPISASILVVLLFAILRKASRRTIAWSFLAMTMLLVSALIAVTHRQGPLPEWAGNVMAMAGGGLYFAIIAGAVAWAGRAIVARMGSRKAGLLDNWDVRVQLLDQIVALRVGKPINRPQGLLRYLGWLCVNSSFAAPYWSVRWYRSQSAWTNYVNRRNAGRLGPFPKYRKVRMLELRHVFREPVLDYLKERDYLSAAKLSEQGCQELEKFAKEIPQIMRTILAQQLYLLAALAHQATGRIEEALAYYEKADQVSASIHPMLRIEPLMRHASLLYELKDYEKAAEIFGIARTTLKQITSQFKQRRGVPPHGLILRALYRRGLGFQAADTEVSIDQATQIEDFLLRADAMRSEIAYSMLLCGWNSKLDLDEQALMEEVIAAPCHLERRFRKSRNFAVAAARYSTTRRKDVLDELSDEDEAPSPSDAAQVLDRSRKELHAHFSFLLQGEKFIGRPEEVADHIRAARQISLNGDVLGAANAVWRVLRREPLCDAAWNVLADFAYECGPRIELWPNIVRSKYPDYLSHLWNDRLQRDLPKTYARILCKAAERQRLSNPDKAERLLKFALDIVCSGDDRQGIAEVLLGLSELACLTQRPVSAYRLAELAAQLAKELTSPEVEVRALAAEAKAHWALKDTALAVGTYLRAISLIESGRQGIVDPDTRMLFTGSRADLYGQLIQVLSSIGEKAKALEVLDRSKSRGLVELLSVRGIHARDSASSEDVEEDARLQALVYELEMTRSSDSEAIKEAQQALKRVKERLRKSTSWETLAGPEPISESEVLKMLARLSSESGERVAGISFAVLEDRVLAFVLCPEESHVRELPLSPSDLDSLVEAFGSFMRDAGGESLLSDLYRKLFEPIAPILREYQATMLVIVPHQQLHVLPLHAASWTGDAGRLRFLIEDYAVVFVPSFSALATLLVDSPAAGGEALVFGNPDPPRDLPGGEVEAVQVADILGGQSWIGKDATEARFRVEAPGASIIHLACHGRFASYDPLQSHVMLADGYLQMDEVFDLDLKANLVVLSACESAVGKISFSDDLLGMVRAWLYAGCGSVMASLWSVNDASTAEIMVEFYRLWRQEGATKARAMQRAQAKWIEVTRGQYDLLWKGQASPSEADLRPFLWSPFVLIGNPL